LIGAITGAEHGNSYWLDCQHYYKCAAMICENLDKAKQTTFTIGE
jgi:sphingosine kinase